MINVTENEALAFLTAGGVLRLTDWMALSEGSRDAFVAAGETFARAKAMMTAILVSDATETKGEGTEEKRVHDLLEEVADRG